MSPQAYRPADVAKEVGVSTNTIRGWCNQFGEYLSDRATPRPGVERVLSELDRTILHYIADLRQNGLGYDEIDSRLAETAFSEAETLPVSVDQPEETAIQPTNDMALTILASSVQTIAQTLAESADRSREIEQLRSEMAQLRLLVIIGALGIIAALLIGFLFLLTT